jgi:GntR family transcriptional regulator
MSSELDDLSGKPRYLQIALIIESEIQSGSTEIGDPIPSQVQISQRFGVAKATAAKAHAWLAERGYVVAVPGVGMVVTPRERWKPDPPTG